MLELVYPIDDPAPMLPSVTADMAARMHSPKKAKNPSEIFPVIDENGVVIGRATRAYCHSGSHLLHPVVHLHLVDREGRIYLQKRSGRKDIEPGKWDTSVGGHITYGESILEALYREAGEELNLSEFNPVFLGTYRLDTDVDSVLVIVFAAVGSFKPAPDGEEVEEGRWWTPEEIDAASANGPKSPLTANFTAEYADIKSRLSALL